MPKKWRSPSHPSAQMILTRIMMQSICPGECFTSLDLKAPRIFTRVVAATQAPLQLCGIRILPYLDHWLICAPSWEQVIWNTEDLAHIQLLGLFPAQTAGEFSGSEFQFHDSAGFHEISGTKYFTIPSANFNSATVRSRSRFLWLRIAGNNCTFLINIICCGIFLLRVLYCIIYKLLGLVASGLHAQIGLNSSYKIINWINGLNSKSLYSNIIWYCVVNITVATVLLYWWHVFCGAEKEYRVSLRFFYETMLTFCVLQCLGALGMIMLKVTGGNERKEISFTFSMRTWKR